MHHDGITGTARLSVVSDYLSRLNKASAGARRITKDMSALLLARNVSPVAPCDLLCELACLFVTLCNPVCVTLCV